MGSDANRLRKNGKIIVEIMQDTLKEVFTKLLQLYLKVLNIQ